MHEQFKSGSRDEAIAGANPGESTAARQAELLRLLETGAGAIITSEHFQEHLRAQTKFWHYSANNTLLIMLQKPDATRVNTYPRWRALGRQVRRGERGIKIFYPYTKTLVDEETGDETARVAGFGVGNVFAYEQTEGEPLPAPPTPAERFGVSDVAGEIDRRLSAWAIGEGLRLEQQPLAVVRGYFHPGQRELVLNANLAADDGRLKTLVHEAAHFVSGHTFSTSEHGERETVAEGAAFVVLGHFGMDTAGYSFPYVARFAGDPELVRRHLQTIQRVSATLITAIEDERPDEMGEWS